MSKCAKYGKTAADHMVEPAIRSKSVKCIVAYHAKESCITTRQAWYTAYSLARLMRRERQQRQGG